MQQDLLLTVLHIVSAFAVVGAKSVLPLTTGRLFLILCTKFGRFHFTESSCKSCCLRLGHGAVTREMQSTKLVHIRITISSIHTKMVLTWTNIYFKFALQTSIATGAYTVFKVIVVCLAEQMTTVDAKVLKNLQILGAFAANTMVKTLKRALFWGNIHINKLTHWTNKTIQAITAEVPEDDKT